MKRKSIRVAAAILALLSLCLSLASCGGGFDYRKHNLGRYMSLSSSDYLGIQVELKDSYEVTDGDVDNAIEDICIKHKTLMMEGTESYPIHKGDVAYVFYWGTTHNEKNGYDIQFSGGTNMTGSSATALTIGSGQFVPGFEDGLIGVTPIQTSRDYISKSGTEVKAGNIVYLSIEHYQYDDGKGNVTTGSFSGLRVDLANPGILGEAFARKLTGMTVGATVDCGYSSDWENGRLSIDWDGDGTMEKLAITGRIMAVATSEISVPVQVRFPEGYQDKTLAGKEATFHVVVTKSDAYTIPELTEELIKQAYPSFKTEETDVVAAFRVYLREQLQDEKKDQRKNDIEAAIWDVLSEKASFKGKLPSKAVKQNYDKAYDQMLSEYSYYNRLVSQNYGYTFSTIDEFAEVYYGLEKGQTWKTYLNQQAKEMTQEKMIIYRIVQQEGWDLTDKEYEEGAEKLIKYYMELYHVNADRVIAMVGEEAIYESVLYDKVMEKLSAAATVTEK